MLRDDGALRRRRRGGGLFLSTDGGLNWTTPAHTAPAGLRDLAALPGGGLSAVGEQGALLLSTDGGFTWVETGPPTATNLRHHCWTSDQAVFVTSDDGAWRSPDAGATWFQMVSGVAFGMNEVYFTDACTATSSRTSPTGPPTTAASPGPSTSTPCRRSTATAPCRSARRTGSSASPIEGGELWETTDAGLNWTQHLYRPVMGFPSLYQAPGGRVFFGSDAGDLYYTRRPWPDLHQRGHQPDRRGAERADELPHGPPRRRTLRGQPALDGERAAELAAQRRRRPPLDRAAPTCPPSAGPLTAASSTTSAA